MQAISLLAATDKNSGGANLLISLLPFVAIGAIMYFLLIRPQKRRQRDAAALQQDIGIGDEVMTTSGLYGWITGFDEENGLAFIEVDDDVQIRVARQAIQRKVDTAKGETGVPNDDGSKSRQTKIDEPSAAADDES